MEIFFSFIIEYVNEPRGWFVDIELIKEVTMYSELLLEKFVKIQRKGGT